MYLIDKHVFIRKLLSYYSWSNLQAYSFYFISLKYFNNHLTNIVIFGTIGHAPYPPLKCQKSDILRRLFFYSRIVLNYENPKIRVQPKIISNSFKLTLKMVLKIFFLHICLHFFVDIINLNFETKIPFDGFYNDLMTQRNDDNVEIFRLKFILNIYRYVSYCS